MCKQICNKNLKLREFLVSLLVHLNNNKFNIKFVVYEVLKQIRLAQGRAAVSKVTNIRIPQMAGNFLTECVLKFSIEALLHGVSESALKLQSS
jgi:hypothetical protein